MRSGDECLQVVLAAAVAQPAQQFPALRDLVPAPAGSVLVGQQDEAAFGVQASVAAGVLQDHQGEQRDDLVLVRQQLAEEVAETDRFAGQSGFLDCRAGARAVPLGKQQIDDLEHDGQPVPADRGGSQKRHASPGSGRGRRPFLL